MSTTVSLDQIIARTGDLPSMPTAILRVMREAESSTSSAATVAKAISTDQALTVRVLRLANSSFYGLERKVGDLAEAVVVLGMRSVKNLAIVASTYPWMVRPVPGYCLGPNELWTHGFATAVASQEIAKYCKRVSEEQAFTAGLLHDIGKIALGIWLENKIQAINHYAIREQITFEAAERKVLGYDHTQVGEHLARQWNLPEDICAACRWHHSPDRCDPLEPIVDCVHLGDYLATSMGFGLGGDGLQYGLDPGALARLGLEAESLDEITDSFVTEFEHFETLFQEVAA